MTKAQTIFFMVCLSVLALQVFRSVGKKMASTTTVTEQHFSGAR